MIETLIVKSNKTTSAEFLEKFSLTKESYTLYSICDVYYLKPNINCTLYQNIIISSIHAVEYLKIMPLPKTTRLHIVGKNIKSEVKNLGFKQVDTYSKIEDLAKKLLPTEKYLYLRGNHITLNLAAKMPNITDLIVYNLKYHDYLDENLVIKLKSGQIKKIFLFSHLNTTNFIKLSAKYNIKFYNTVFYVMSEKAYNEMLSLGLECKFFEYDKL